MVSLELWQVICITFILNKTKSFIITETGLQSIAGFGIGTLIDSFISDQSDLPRTVLED